ncbi:CDC45-domain-containing protein, partial [Tilletiaria anomala UBC 951]
MVLIHPPREASDPYYDARAPDYALAYLDILKKSRCASFSISSTASANAAVLLLVSPDPDALCAARVLVRLLTDDDIPHRLVPVDGYATLQRIIETDVVGNDELHTLVFLNLGSVLSLPTYFTVPKCRPEFQVGRSSSPSASGAGAPLLGSNDEDEDDEVTGFPLPPKCSLHILDSHRPWNLDNLFATSDMMERIFVWDDGEVIEKLAAEAEAYEKLEFDWGIDSDSDSEDSGGSEDDKDESEDVQSEDDEDEDEEEGEGGQRRRKRRRLGSRDDDEDSAISSPRRRRRKSKKPKDLDRPRKLSSHERARLQGVLQRYYHKGTNMGLAVSGMAYLLA